MTETPPYFAKTALSGFASNGAAQAIKIGLQFLSVIILARFLSPEDFGLIAAVAPLLAFVILFQDIGLQQAVIQRKEMSEEQFNQVFWFTVAIGSTCMVIVMVLSPGIAAFYGDVRLTEITFITSFTLLFNSIGALPLGLLSRNLKFSSVALVNIIGAVIGFIAAMIAVSVGLGYWALVFSPLFMALASTISAFVFSKWKPSKPDFKIDREMFSFGANLTGFNILNFFSRNLDNILIGRYLGTSALGFYDLAYKLLLFPIRSINDPLSKVIVPILSKMQDDKERLRRVYLRTLGLMLLLTVPGIAAVTIAAEDIILILLGEKWLGIVPVFSWLGIASLIQVMNNSTGWIFISQGYTSTMFKWGIYSSITIISSFIIGIQFGLVGVAMAYTIVSYTLNFPVLYTIMGHVGPVRTNDFMMLQLPLLAAAALSYLIMLSLFRETMGLSGISYILITLIVSYSLALSTYTLHRLGRSSLKEIAELSSKAKDFLDKKKAKN